MSEKTFELCGIQESEQWNAIVSYCVFLRR